MYQFKYRMDDPQIGRFWSVDPLASKYVYNSPYAFSEDKVTGHVELEGLEAVDVKNQYVRASLRADVQQKVEQFNNHASAAASVTVSVGLGVGYEQKIGNTSVKVEASGPQASVSVNSGGKVSAEGSAASATIKGGVGSISGQGEVKVGVVNFSDGKLSSEYAIAETKIGPDMSKTVGDKNAFQTVSADNTAVTIGVELGVIGLKVAMSIQESAAAVSSWVSAVGSYFKSVGDEASSTLKPYQNAPH
jgi:hypothetical protein